MRLLFIVDPLERLELAGDTTYALMLEAVSRGHEVWTCQPEHLSLEHDDVVAAAQPTQVGAAHSHADAPRSHARQPLPRTP